MTAFTPEQTRAALMADVFLHAFNHDDCGVECDIVAGTFERYASPASPIEVRVIHEPPEPFAHRLERLLVEARGELMRVDGNRISEVIRPNGSLHDGVSLGQQTAGHYIENFRQHARHPLVELDAAQPNFILSHDPSSDSAEESSEGDAR